MGMLREAWLTPGRRTGAQWRVLPLGGHGQSHSVNGAGVKQLIVMHHAEGCSTLMGILLCTDHIMMSVGSCFIYLMVAVKSASAHLLVGAGQLVGCRNGQVTELFPPRCNDTRLPGHSLGTAAKAVQRLTQQFLWPVPCWEGGGQCGVRGW